MKIQKLHIDSFRHLENVEFDFTYQTGERKGQPLDKICLIGQSATGKTSVLEAIKIISHNSEDIKMSKIEKAKIKSEFKEDDYLFFCDEIGVIEHATSHYGLNSQYNDTIFYYFTAEILSPNNFNFFTENSSITFTEQIFNKEFFSPNKTLENKTLPTNSDVKKDLNYLLYKKILNFNYRTNKDIWNFLLNDIIEYRNKLTQKGSELINKGLHADFKKLGIEMEYWKNENPNPLIELAEKCLNPIFKKVNLEVDIVDTSVAIPLKPINKDKAIPANALSTGTKQLLLTALPLFKLPTDNTMILIDEPERSLYPDMQIELMDYYKNLAPNAQFIVATHSPFIAAAFEPEERFVLYFGEDGKVKVRNGVSPIGDDPNDILYNDFGLSSVINKAGEEAYKIYLAKKQQMIFEEDKAKKKELLKEVEEIGEKYNF